MEPQAGKHPLRKGQLRRWLRLGLFAAAALLLSLLALDLLLAWGYVWVFTHPGCAAPPPLPPDFPPPQEVMLTSRDHRQIRAWYFPPRNGAALLAFGGPTGALGNRQPPVLFLVQQGFGALQIDSRACAQPPAAVTLGGKELWEAEAGLDFLLAQPEVRAVGAIGYSMGGVTAIRLTARRPEVSAVVAEGGYFNLGQDIVEPQQSKPPYVQALLYSVAGIFWLQSGVNPWEISPIDDLPRISPRPVLLIYGEHEAASGRAQQQFQAALPPKELWIVPGGSHGRNYAQAPEAYQQRVLAFFQVALLTAPAPSQ